MATKKKSGKRAEPSIPETLNTPEFAAAWADWQKFTTERGMPLGDAVAVRQLKMLAKLGAENAIADIRKAMDEHPLKDRVPDEVAKKCKARAKAETSTEDAAKTDGEAPAKSAKSKKAKAPKDPKAKKMSALDAAVKVLEEKGEPMTTQEMIEAMSGKGYWKSPGGLTLAATLYSAILREMNTKGADSPFTKTERGKFARA